MPFNFQYSILKCTLKIFFAALMLLDFIASISWNTVQVYILNKQMSHADSEHELKCMHFVYTFMHFDFVKLDLSQNRVKVSILNKYMNHADFFLIY